MSSYLCHAWIPKCHTCESVCHTYLCVTLTSVPCLPACHAYLCHVHIPVSCLPVCQLPVCHAYPSFMLGNVTGWDWMSGWLPKATLPPAYDTLDVSAVRLRRADRGHQGHRSRPPCPWSSWPGRSVASCLVLFIMLVSLTKNNFVFLIMLVS